MAVGWTDEVTAISTALTAALSGLAGAAAFIALRRDAKRQLPLVEATLSWNEQGYVIAAVAIRNRIPETLDLTCAEIRVPRGSRISVATNLVQGRVVLAPPENRRIELRISIAPVDTPRRAASLDPADVETREFHIAPPPGWSGGKIRLVLWISSRALTIRNKRIVMRKSMSAPPAPKIAPPGIKQIPQ